MHSSRSACASGAFQPCQCNGSKFGAFNAKDALDVQASERRRWKYIATRAHTAVMHEMGHSVGLRHNFVGSSDALNYRPQYWQLRTKNGTVSTECTELSKRAELRRTSVLRPHDAGRGGGTAHMFMHSSVMDYAGESRKTSWVWALMILQQLECSMAIRFRFSRQDLTDGDQNGLGCSIKWTTLAVFWASPGSGTQSTMHYSQLRTIYDLIDCQPVEIDTFKPRYWDTEVDGEWHQYSMVTS